MFGEIRSLRPVGGPMINKNDSFEDLEYIRVILIVNYLSMDITPILRVQSFVRAYLSTSRDIYSVLKKNNVQQIFEDEISGYHTTSKNPLKEAMWEEINANIMRPFCSVSEEAMGNHKPGIDNKFGIWGISNKTAKITKTKKLNISSYRLTTVSKTNDVSKVVEEILKRDSSYDYYSILVREELPKDDIKYSWIVVPKDFYTFNPEKYEWTQKLGNLGKQTGWKSKFMDTTDSMSSQLWFHMNFEDVERYVVASTTVNVSNIMSFSSQANIMRQQELEIEHLKNELMKMKNGEF